MSTFVESEHPRGQVANAGQFREKVNSTPASELAPEEPIDEPYRPVWTVLADRVVNVQHAVDKANRRLERAGVTERFTFETTLRVEQDSQGRLWQVADVKLSRPAIAVGDWRFEAAHETTPAGAVISHYANDHIERTDVSDMRCDHCGKTRSRSKVYTVRNKETGETMQVGGSCLSLFLGVKPEGLWALSAELEADDDGFDPDYYGGFSGQSNALEGEQLLLATIRQIQAGGWLSKGRAGWHDIPTIDAVDSNWHALTERPASAEEATEITAIADWAASLDPKDSDYAANISAAFTRGPGGELVIARKHRALAASAVQSYRNHLKRQREKAAREDLAQRKLAEFAFPVKTNLRDKGLELTILSERQGIDYGYGAPTHVTMMDDAGHVFYWKASNFNGGEARETPDGNWMNWQPQEGARVRIVGGSVKDHRVSDYTGDHETVLQRVKLDPPAGVLEEFDALLAAERAAEDS